MESQLLEHNFVVSLFPTGQKNVTTPFYYLHLTFLFFISFMIIENPLILKLRKSSLMTDCNLILWLSWPLFYIILMHFYKHTHITMIWKPLNILAKEISCRELIFATQRCQAGCTWRVIPPHLPLSQNILYPTVSRIPSHLSQSCFQ